MKRRNLENLIAEHGGLDLVTVGNRIQRIREAGLLPTGGRGLGGAEYGALHVAVGLIGTVAAQRNVDAVTAARTYPSMEPDGDVCRFTGAGNFGDAVAAILADRDLAGRVGGVTICRTFPAAVITFFDDAKGAMGEQRFIFDEEASPDVYLDPGISIEVTLRASLLHALGVKFWERGHPASGWGTPPHLLTGPGAAGG